MIFFKSKFIKVTTDEDREVYIIKDMIVTLKSWQYLPGKYGAIVEILGIHQNKFIYVKDSVEALLKLI